MFEKNLTSWFNPAIVSHPIVKSLHAKIKSAVPIDEIRSVFKKYGHSPFTERSTTFLLDNYMWCRKHGEFYRHKVPPYVHPIRVSHKEYFDAYLRLKGLNGLDLSLETGEKFINKDCWGRKFENIITSKPYCKSCVWEEMKEMKLKVEMDIPPNPQPVAELHNFLYDFSRMIFGLDPIADMGFIQDYIYDDRLTPDDEIIDDSHFWAEFTELPNKTQDMTEEEIEFFNKNMSDIQKSVAEEMLLESKNEKSDSESPAEKSSNWSSKVSSQPVPWDFIKITGSDNDLLECMTVSDAIDKFVIQNDLFKKALSTLAFLRKDLIDESIIPCAHSTVRDLYDAVYRLFPGLPNDSYFKYKELNEKHLKSRVLKIFNYRVRSDGKPHSLIEYFEPNSFCFHPRMEKNKCSEVDCQKMLYDNSYTKIDQQIIGSLLGANVIEDVLLHYPNFDFEQSQTSIIHQILQSESSDNLSETQKKIFEILKVFMGITPVHKGGKFRLSGVVEEIKLELKGEIYNPAALKRRKRKRYKRRRKQSKYIRFLDPDVDLARDFRRLVCPDEASDWEEKAKKKAKMSPEGDENDTAEKKIENKKKRLNKQFRKLPDPLQINIPFFGANNPDNEKSGSSGWDSDEGSKSCISSRPFSPVPSDPETEPGFKIFTELTVFNFDWSEYGRKLAYYYTNCNYEFPDKSPKNFDSFVVFESNNTLKTHQCSSTILAMYSEKLADIMKIFRGIGHEGFFIIGLPKELSADSISYVLAFIHGSEIRCADDMSSLTEIYTTALYLKVYELTNILRPKLIQSKIMCNDQNLIDLQYEAMQQKALQLAPPRIFSNFPESIDNLP